MTQLLNGDCLEVLKTLADSSIDLVIADLPYGQTKCDWDITIDMTKLWAQLLRIGKNNTAYIFFCTTKFGYSLIESNKKMFRYDLVWEKPNSRCGFLNCKKMPIRKHEMIYVFYAKLPTYNIEDNHVKLHETILGGHYDTGVYGKTKNISTGTTYEPILPGSVVKYNVNGKKNTQPRNLRGYWNGSSNITAREAMLYWTRQWEVAPQAWLVKHWVAPLLVSR